MGCAADRAENTLKSAPTCCFHSCSMLLSKSLIFRFAMPAYLGGCKGGLYLIELRYPSFLACREAETA